MLTTTGNLSSLAIAQQPLPATQASLQTAGAPNEPVLWSTAMSLDLLLGPGHYLSPVAAGRPDILLFDAPASQLRTQAWRSWTDVGDYFRLAGLPLNASRRVLVPRESEVEKDVREGLGWQRAKTSRGHALARSFYNGQDRGEIDAVCSLIRLGLTEPHATRNLPHYMAVQAIEPAIGTGVSLIERLNILKRLFEEPQQVGNGAHVWQMPAPYSPGIYLTRKNESGRTPLELAVLTRNKPMEEALRFVTGQFPPPPAMPEFPAPNTEYSLATEWDFSLDDLLALPPPAVELPAYESDGAPPPLTGQLTEAEASEIHPDENLSGKLDPATETRRSARLLAKRQRSTDTAFTESISGDDVATLGLARKFAGKHIELPLTNTAYLTPQPHRKLAG